MGREKVDRQLLSHRILPAALAATVPSLGARRWALARIAHRTSATGDDDSFECFIGTKSGLLAEPRLALTAGLARAALGWAPAGM
jgi:hypothetical protein